jgi:hypothetical protein
MARNNEVTTITSSNTSFYSNKLMVIFYQDEMSSFRLRPSLFACFRREERKPSRELTTYSLRLTSFIFQYLFPTS